METISYTLWGIALIYCFIQDRKIRKGGMLHGRTGTQNKA